MADDPWASFRGPDANADAWASFRGPASGEATAQSKDNRGVVDKLLGIGGERYQTWPEKLIRGVGTSITSGASLPGDVYAGKDTPDNTGRVLDLAMIANPLSAGRATARMAPAATAGPVETAAALGAPLPKGLASPNAGVQAITQASRQLPFVGQNIEEKTAATIGKAGQAVEDVAGGMGAADRSTVGGNLRDSISGAIDTNKQSIDQSYAGVRSLINPDKKYPADKTLEAIDSITKRRAEAGQPNPSAGLEQFENIGLGGVNFNGLIRAKSDLAHSVDFLNAHAGFSNADKKQLGAAMSQDLGSIVARSASDTGANPATALASLRQAELEASQLIRGNQTLGKLTRNSRDEGITNVVMNAASSKNGNLQLLSQLKAQLPEKDFQQIGGTVLSELGQNPATGSFSLNKFATNWEKMSPDARSALFPQQHAKFLDEIAKLGKYLKNSDQYMNTSGSGRAVALAGLIGSAGGAAVAATMGHYAPLLSLGASVGGGYVLAKSLASPAVSASVAQLSRRVIAYDRAPSAANRAGLMLASRNAVNNFASYNNVSPAEFLKMLQAPAKSAADQNQQPIPGGPGQ